MHSVTWVLRSMLRHRRVYRRYILPYKTKDSLNEAHVLLHTMEVRRSALQRRKMNHTWDAEAWPHAEASYLGNLGFRLMWSGVVPPPLRFELILMQPWCFLELKSECSLLVSFFLHDEL